MTKKHSWVPPVSMLALHNMYVKEGMGLQAMADLAGVSVGAIWRWLRWYAIPRRRTGPRPWCLREETTDQHGYVRLYRPEHLRAIQGRVLRCIVNWEEANGVPFPEGKEPHHKNEDKTDDRPENIEPLTHVEHSRLTARSLAMRKEVE